METPQSGAAYMLLFRGNDWHKGLSPQEIQKVTDQWMAWFDGLMKEGKAKSGHPLEPTGKMVSGKNGRVVADGPFAESKEAIGGYFFLEVDSLEEAIAIAQKCPGLDYGAVVEVRPVADTCPLSKGIQQTATEAQLVGATALSTSNNQDNVLPTSDENNVSSPPRDISGVVEHLFRHEPERLFSALTRVFGFENLSLAEDVVQEALVRALKTWPYYGVPAKSSGLDHAGFKEPGFRYRSAREDFPRQGTRNCRP